MPQIGEMVAASNISDDKEKCPFCPNKSLSDCKAKKQEPETKVISKPNQLNCEPLQPKGQYPYTTAKHHLISAKQCYAKLKRLVRMGSMAKYKLMYGRLSDQEKRTVAFEVMRTEKAQWHVGHHAVEIELADGWANEEDDTPWRRGHLVQYDTEVIAKLIKLMAKFTPAQTCDETKPDTFKSNMDALSAEIKEKLNKFKTDTPGGSSPFFVSQLSADYAKAHEAPPQPPAKKTLALVRTPNR
jgi:hypothetical protein